MSKQERRHLAYLTSQYVRAGEGRRKLLARHLRTVAQRNDRLPDFAAAMLRAVERTAVG